MVKIIAEYRGELTWNAQNMISSAKLWKTEV